MIGFRGVTTLKERQNLYTNPCQTQGISAVVKTPVSKANEARIRHNGNCMGKLCPPQFIFPVDTR